MIALALIAAAAAPGWAEFSKKGSQAWSTTVVQIGTTGWDADHKHLDYWMRMTHAADMPHAAKDNGGVWWADSRQCPAMRGVIARMKDIPSPQIDPPDGFVGSIEADGIDYTLRAPALTSRIHGDLILTSNVETPLAAWVESSLKALGSCWSRTVPAGYKGR